MKVPELKKPAVRYPEFGGNWDSAQLGEYLEFKNGFNAEKSQYGIGTKFINVLDIINESPISYDSIIGKVTMSEAEFKNYEVKFGDILFQRSSETREEVGQSNVYLDKNNTVAFGGFVIRGAAKQNYDPLFLHYLLKTESVRKDITSRSGGSTRYNIGQESLREVRIFLPTQAEQQKIAAFLSAVDKRIRGLDRKKALFLKYRIGVMQQIFDQKIRFKDDNGNDLPDWESVELKKVSQRVKQKNTSNEVNLVLTNSASMGIISQTDYFDKNIANPNNLSSYYIVDRDDFVYNPRISSAAPVGPIKRNKFGKGVMSPLYMVFRLHGVNFDFFEYFFETSLWHDYMRSIANFGARHDRMNITTHGFFEMPVLVPSLAEQQKISTFLRTLDYKIELVNQQLERLKTFKEGLLQQMFV